ncbi:MAG: HEAT repeat domain-containing protein, partial [Myxococcota bacterium]
ADADLLRLHYYAYDITDLGAPKLLGGPLSIDDPHENGFLRVVDLDGDRRQELVVVGGTDGASISEVRVYSWRARFQDTVWGEDEGTGYVCFDYDRDGVKELLALSPPEQERGDVDVQVLDLVAGTWRRTSPRRPLTSWAPDAFQALVERGPIERPHIELDLLTRVMTDLELNPPRRADAHRVLRERFARTKDPTRRSALLRAMYWPNDTDAIALFRDILSSDTDAPLSLNESTLEVSSTAAHMLARVGSRADRSWLLGSMRAVQATHPRALTDTYLARILTGFTRAGDMRAAQEVLIALSAEHGDTSPAIDMPRVHDAMGHPEHLRLLSEALRRAREPEAQCAILEWMALALRRSKGSSLGVQRRDLLTFLNAPDVLVRASAAGALAALATTSSSRLATQELLARLRIERDSPVREALLQALVEIPDAAPNTAMLLSRLHGPMSSSERTSTHQLIARVDEPLAWRMALPHVARAEDITPYVDSFEAHARGPRDGRWKVLSEEVVGLTTHKDKDVRLASCALMSKLDTPQTHEATAERASLDPDADVRVACIRALGSIRAHEHTPMLLEMARARTTDDADIRAAIYETLSALWSPQTRSAFMAALAEDLDDATSNSILDALAPRHAEVLADRDLRYAVRAHARRRVERASACAPIVDVIARVFAIGLSSAPLILVRTEFLKTCDGRSEELTVAALDALAAHPRQNLRGFVKRWRNFPKRSVRRAAARADGAYNAPQ